MNRILNLLNQSASPQQNNPTQMLQQFAQFKDAMRGRDPQVLVNQLLAQGKMTPQQLEQLKQQAMSLRGILK